MMQSPDEMSKNARAKLTYYQSFRDVPGASARETLAGAADLALADLLRERYINKYNKEPRTIEDVGEFMDDDDRT